MELNLETVLKRPVDNPDGYRHIKIHTCFCNKEQRYKTVIFDVMPNGEQLTGDLRRRFLDDEAAAKQSHEDAVIEMQRADWKIYSASSK